ncbi:hypothetical protein DFO45_0288 [Azorhizobium sp. AG788]|nr:hypothetical protein DFO45_0288 [Azorhizobium sp. AG788]
MTDHECEIRSLDGGWEAVGVEEALGLPSSLLKRCPECHGRVRVHRASVNGMRAHFEHMEAHRGCSLSRGVPFSGVSSPHPVALD